MLAWACNEPIYQPKISYNIEYVISIGEPKFSENLDETHLRHPSVGVEPGNSEIQPAKLGSMLIISELLLSIPTQNDAEEADPRIDVNPG